MKLTLCYWIIIIIIQLLCYAINRISMVEKSCKVICSDKSTLSNSKKQKEIPDNE